MNTLRRRPSDDEGIAMLTVLLAMVILTGFGSVVLMSGIQALPQAKHAQDFDAALGAAEAGVDDYVDRLDQNYNYATSPDSNAAFTSYVPVSVGSPASYTYSVDTSQLTTNGSITLKVTGKVNKTKRTLKVGLRPYGFLDALSLSDYNLVDPALFPVISNSVSATTSQCVWHAWETNTYAGGKGPGSGCSGLINYWITGNVLNGPMQSNDDYYLCGTPQFNDTVDSGDPTSTNSPYWKDPAGCGGDAPKFLGGAPRGQHQVSFPPSSSTLKAQVTVGNSSLGCLYTGPTSIQINGNKMTVVSPDTKSTNTGCVGTNVALPANRTIYVQDIPGTGDPNFGVCQITVTWSGDACNKGDAFVSGNLSDQLTIAADNNIVITGNVTYDSTVATNPRRVLGLIATNSVVINHPVANDSVTCNGLATDSSGYCNVTGTVQFGTGSSAPTYTVPLVNPTVQAALLSLQHSFAVQSFDKGPSTGLGSVNLTGAVAGRFMDIEGVFGAGGTLIHGYGVNYTYDNRLRAGGLVPPNFLDPSQTFWHRISFIDCGNGSTGC